jgi:hypothetical protein
MRAAAVLLLLGPLLPQADPAAAARKDLGPGFAVERVDAALLLARPVELSDGGALRDSLLKAAKEFRGRILDCPVQNPLLIILFGSAESYLAYTSKRYGGPVPQTTYYDVPNRRVLLRTEAAAAYAVQAARIYLLTECLNGNAVPPWMAAALSLLDDPDPEPATFDHRAALLQEAVRRGTLPPLKAYFALDLGSFHRRDVLSLHTSMALKLAEYLEKKGALKKFFDEYRKGFRKDPGGGAALEAALGTPLADADKAFAAHLKALPWLNRDRFLDQAKKVFGAAPLIQVDEDLKIAVTGNVEARIASQALEGVRKLREPLVSMLGLTTSGLPVLARLFKDQESFQEYAKVDAPHRQWLGGYFSYDSRWLVLHLEPDSGSLTHEYCHALIEDDVGILPPWISEGLASLYERYRLDGGLPQGERGSTLRDVKAGLLQNRLAALDAFVAFRGQQFYDPERVRLNYDLARAVCLFLQEKNVLVAVYKEIKAAKAANPLAPPIATCRAAVEKALGAKMDKVNDDFRNWIVASKD